MLKFKHNEFGLDIPTLTKVYIQTVVRTSG